MTFEEADILCDEITDFMLECGGVYTNLNAHMQIEVLRALATGQYIIHRDDSGKITHFICYRFVENGVLHVIEHASTEGRPGMTQIIKELRKISGNRQGVTWNSKGRGVKTFLKQKGVME